MEQNGIGSLMMEGDMKTNWKLFKRRLLTYIDAYFTDANERRKIGILLHHAGDYCQDVYGTFELKPADKLEDILKKFDNHFFLKET